MFDENSNATAGATLVGPAATNAALPTNNLNSTNLFNQLLNVKDSRWLQLEVCREFQRGQCSRTDQECKFAHPASHIDIQNGRVTACYDSIKYYHPVPHLKDQLLINGRNNLAIKNLLCSQLTQPATIPTTLQMTQLMQQNQSTAMQLPPYYYSPLTAIYPLLPTTADFQTLSPVVAQQLALLQGQQQAKPQQVAGATLPLANPALANLQLQQQVALQTQLAAQQQAALYGSSAATSPPLANPSLATLQLQQQAALLSALAAQQQQVVPQVTTPTLSLNAPESRKRTARVVGFEDGGSEEKKPMSTAPTSSASNALLQAVTTSSSSTTDYTLQQQLLLLNAASANNVSNGLANGKRHLDKNGLPANGHAIPIYAQQPSAPQFGPYIGYAPVSYSGQLPPRF